MDQSCLRHGKNKDVKDIHGFANLDLFPEKKFTKKNQNCKHTFLPSIHLTEKSREKLKSKQKFYRVFFAQPMRSSAD